LLVGWVDGIVVVAFGATLRSLVRLPFVAFFRRVFSEFSETRTRRRRLAVARVLGAREQKNGHKVPEHQQELLVHDGLF
jgi:hypothetical protein